MHTSLKILLALTLGLLVVAGVLLYTNFKKAVRLDSLTLDATHIAQDTVTLNMNLRIDNPFFFDFTLHKLQYQAALAGKQLLDDSARVNQRITDTTRLEIPVTLNYQQLRSRLKALDPQDSALLDVRFAVNYTLPLLGQQQTAIDQTLQVPVPQLFDITMEDIAVQRFGFQNIALNVDMWLKNPNKVSATIDDLVFDVSLNESTLLQGTRAASIDVPPQENVYFTLPIRVKTGAITREVFDKITQGDDLHLYLDGSCVLRLEEDAPVDSVQIHFDTEGPIQLP